MSKLLKIAVAVVITAAAVAGIATYLLLSNLDNLVKSLIETAGTEATGVAVSVGSVSIDLAAGRGVVSGLSIANPQGFSTEPALEVDRAEVVIDLAALSPELAELDRVQIDGTRVRYEQKASSSNLKTILDQLEENSTVTAEEAGSGETDVRLIIDEFIFGPSAATLALPRLGQLSTVSLPEIRLSGIGRKSGGATAGDVARQVLEPVLRDTIRAGTGIDADALRERARDELDGVRERAGKKAGEKLDQLFRGRD